MSAQNDSKRTAKLTKKVPNGKLTDCLPWILALILAICLALTSVKSALTVDLSYLTCGKDLVNEFSTARYTFLMDKNNDDNKTAYKTVVDKISQKFNHQGDPTCVYAKIKYFIDVADYTKAQEEFKQLTSLYEQGRIADSRYLAIDNLEQIRSNASGNQNLVPVTNLAAPQL